MSEEIKKARRARCRERERKLREIFRRLREVPTYEPDTPYQGSKHNSWRELMEARTQQAISYYQKRKAKRQGFEGVEQTSEFYNCS